jgi:microcystin-dependent protein
MPYSVNFTDKENKTPITVFDNTSSTDTSLTFPGRNVTGYGQIIAENFLALLENFASADEPINPIEGQLWYNSTDGVLQIWDNTAWKAASGIQKGVSEPSVAASKVGELWVDTTNQQLRIFTGTRWILVGPSESAVDGLRYGPVVEKVADSDNIDRFILVFYIADIPVIIFSKDSFTPKTIISGFNIVRSGINISDPSTAPEIAEFVGGFEPILFGTATRANALNVGGVEVESGKFLRSDTINTTDFAFNIRNNNGVTVGVDGTFNIGTTATAAKIYNSAAGSSIDIQTNRDGIPSTILKVVDNRVGINQATPSQALDIDGSLTLTGAIIVTNNTASTNLNNGSFRTVGGAAITKNLIVGDGADITGTAQVNNLQPKTTELYDLGTSLKRWKTIRAKTIIADDIQGVLSGNISGNANTATSLTNITSFQLAGDVISPAVQFDGQVGSYTKIFNTSLTANIIVSKDQPFPNVSKPTDFVLTYRASEAALASSGLLKQTRDTFVGDLGIPIGGIIPYAGTNAPYGFLFCDGSEVERTKFSTLYDVIGTTYNGLAVLIGVNTFRLPDLRGRFALGKDNMDNAGTVPIITGGFVDAGGGTTGRVPDVKAITLGGDAGQSSATLTLANLPEHSHTLSSGAQDYSAISVSTTIDPAATTGLGPTAPGQAQYLKDSGGIKKPLLGTITGTISGTTLTIATLSFGTVAVGATLSGVGITPGTTIVSGSGSIWTISNSHTIPVAISMTLSGVTSIGIMNPFLTINYIIRSGPPLF